MVSAINKFDQITSTVQERLGAGQFDALGGRVFKYCTAGGGTLARGKINVAATIVANHQNMSWQTAPAISDKSVKVTLGATAATAEQYKDGWLVVNDGGGEGRAYAVEGHPAADSAGTLTVDLKEKIDTAGVLAEANVDLVKNLYKDIVISVADQLDPVAGVNVVSITTLYSGWVQTWGPCSILIDETLAVGSAIVVGTSVVGAVEAFDFDSGELQIGQMGPQAGVDTEYQLAYLKIDPLYQAG